jgi:hypothetical protein
MVIISIELMKYGRNQLIQKNAWIWKWKFGRIWWQCIRLKEWNIEAICRFRWSNHFVLCKYHLRRIWWQFNQTNPWLYRRNETNWQNVWIWKWNFRINW